MSQCLKLVFLSDTHNRLREIAVPDGDVLIHCGDFTMGGTAEEIGQFNDQLMALPHKHKIVVAGNHEFLFERHPEYARRLLTEAVYLQDESTIVEGLKIYGSPWQPAFHNWAFNVDRGSQQMQNIWNKVPDNTDILVTHSPPHRVLDAVGDRHPGCEILRRRVEKVRPKIHAFGHIHEGYGKIEMNGTLFINACNVNEDYRPVNDPIVIELQAGQSSG